MTGTFDHHLAIVLPGDLRQLAERFQFGKLRFVIRVGNRAGTQTVTERERNVVGRHDLADVAEAGVEETLFVMSQTPFRHNRAASTHNPRGSFGRHRNVRQPHAGVNREIVDTLFGLFDQGVAKDFPGQVFSLAADFFQGLIDRHSADGHRRVADDPLARGVNVLTGRKIHYRV